MDREHERTEVAVGAAVEDALKRGSESGRQDALAETVRALSSLAVDRHVPCFTRLELLQDRRLREQQLQHRNDMEQLREERSEQEKAAVAAARAEMQLQVNQVVQERDEVVQQFQAEADAMRAHYDNGVAAAHQEADERCEAYQHEVDEAFKANEQQLRKQLDVQLQDECASLERDKQRALKEQEQKVGTVLHAAGDGWSSCLLLAVACRLPLSTRSEPNTWRTWTRCSEKRNSCLPAWTSRWRSKRLSA